MDRIADPWGPRTPIAAGAPWPERVDEHLAPGATPDRWVQTASVLNSNGDAYDVAVQDGRIVGVRGRASDRVNRGRLGPKDLYAWQANASPDRLTRPLLRRAGTLELVSWDEAMGAIVDRSRAVLAEQGPDGIGFYTSGQLFLEEYYTLALIARGGIGTNHLDGNTRLCTATAGESLKESFGCDGQPGSYTALRGGSGLQWGGERLYADGRFAAAPDVWVEVAAADAERLGLAEGDLAEVRSARGWLRAPVRITGVREGVVFVPFHYGWWDRPDGPPRVANALTRTAVDPVSKQPLFKSGAVAVVKAG